MDISLGGLEFVPVSEASTLMGTTKGGWVYAGQRPCYEAKTPAFYIMPSPLTEAELARAMGVENEDAEDQRPSETITSRELNELADNLMNTAEFSAAVDRLGGAWELRALTQAEWQAARNQKALSLQNGLTERLADAPSSNNRGAMMDGRPRPNELLGPAAAQTAAIAVHPRNDAITAITSVPLDRPLPKVVARLALSPVRSNEAKRVPEHTDRWRNVRSELLWTTILGIVPSFLIPILRGLGDYATEGWVNLLFGGLCAGFFTGAIWRPRRPVLRYDDVESSSISVAQ
ncbi:hypothetical protein CMO85_01770 [Candidatus Woesearchaeota archaeon]|nr:hypothetical protein [Candidatus Woesearchaeota archaeon]